MMVKGDQGCDDECNGCSPEAEEPSATASSTTSADACEATADDGLGSDIGKDMRSPEALDTFADHCSTPKTPAASKSKRAARQGSSGLLHARNKPDGFLTTDMGSTKGTRLGGQGLWSGGFGTCVGVVITGTPRRPGGHSAFLAHLTLGESWDSVRGQWSRLRQAAAYEGLSGMRAWLYTVDTDPHSPDSQGDRDMEELTGELEHTYTQLEDALQRFIGCGAVVRETHPFSRVGEMLVTPDGHVEMS